MATTKKNQSGNKNNQTDNQNNGGKSGNQKSQNEKQNGDNGANTAHLLASSTLNYIVEITLTPLGRTSRFRPTARREDSTTLRSNLYEYQ